MNGIDYQNRAENAIQPKFGRKKRIRSRYAPRYPYTAEREYRRINRDYVQALQKQVEKQLPYILRAYKRQMRKDTREDGISDFLSFLKNKVYGMASALARSIARLHLEEKIGKIGRMVQDRSIAEWRQAIKDSLGVDVPDDDYRGGQYEQEIQRWISENFNYIRNIPMETLLEIENLIADAYRDGVDIDDLEYEILKRLEQRMNRGQFAAVDSISSLNARMMKMYQQAAGVKKYVWISCRDDRVRPCHRTFDGKTFSWDDPPDDWYMTKSRGRVYTGKKYNPGEAPGCRCCAVPVFEKETFKTPK